MRASCPRAVAISAALFFVVSTAVSSARWANFEYRTFDLAYYVQALWQLLHARLNVSILQVPLLGNHVEPIVFLLAPLFALLPHPLLLVAVQNAALALMAPIGYDIARREGFRQWPAMALAAALLLAPATGYVALHEFHPEALTAPFLLLMFRARYTRSLAQHWIWFCAVLACKENMALLLTAYCATQAVTSRSHGWASVRAWFAWPALFAVSWFLLCTRVITPVFNSGNIDYLALYNRLGATPAEILRNIAFEPHRFLNAIWSSLRGGNLVTGMLLPFLCLPLLRFRWIVIAAPVLLQHLLSWRSSEWMIYFHYAAPLVPLWWIATVEAIPRLQDRSAFRPLAYALPFALLTATAGAQLVLGPAGEIKTTLASWRTQAPDRASKNAILAKIPDSASVIAPLPYLSHVAAREHCYSLHFLLKGLKTLSHVRYEPPPPADFVLIDFGDSATFDSFAGYYHPTMRTADGSIVASSDQLLHRYLAGSSWKEEAVNELLLLTRSDSSSAEVGEGSGEGATMQVAEGTTLLGIRRSSDHIVAGETITVVLDWRLAANRETFPWLELALVSDPSAKRTTVTKGLCAPQIAEGFYRETWQITNTRDLGGGSYDIEARFIDNPNFAWLSGTRSGAAAAPLLDARISLGRIMVDQRPPPAR